MPHPAPRAPVALVTGAARRIGRAVALELASAGWSIAVHYRGNETAAEAVATEIRALGMDAVTLAADLADPAATAALVPRCVAALGAPTCLINNASLFAYDTIATLSPDSLTRHMAVNLAAPVLLSQAFAARLPADVTGSIVNIVDQRVWAPTPEYFSYSLSKSALWSATQMLAQGLAPRIRVNAVGPGPALANVFQSPGEFAAEAAATLLRRGTDPVEIARAIRFILDAPAMTGQMIALDGGQHLRWFPEVVPAGATQQIKEELSP